MDKKLSTLFLVIGSQASGKTTLANKISKQQAKRIPYSRDKIPSGITDYYPNCDLREVYTNLKQGLNHIICLNKKDLKLFFETQDFENLIIVDTEAQ